MGPVQREEWKEGEEEKKRVREGNRDGYPRLLNTRKQLKKEQELVI